MPSQADRAAVATALRLAMERYGECITVSGSVGFKAAVIRAAVDAQLPITFSDPAMESRRQAEATKAQARKRSGVPVGKEPPPQRRHGLRTLGQLDGLHIEGEAQRPAQSPAQAKQPTPKPVPTALEQRAAKLRAEQAAKEAKRQGKWKGRGR